MPTEDIGNVHQVFINDPVHYQSLVHCKVTVHMTDGKEYIGWVHTVDPVSQSVVLVDFEEDGSKNITLVSGYNISDITVIVKTPPQDLAKTIDSIFRKEQVQYSNKQLTERREALCVWLAENRVPYTVKDDMSIEVLQAAVIRQPYNADSIHCTNEVVLDKVMKLVQQMPAPPT